MFEGHDPYLVCDLPVVDYAILGGYTALASSRPEIPRHAGAVRPARPAGSWRRRHFLSTIGIWTMHFVRRAGWRATISPDGGSI